LSKISFQEASMSGGIDFTAPVTSFVIVLLIGIVAGVLFDRFAGPGWLSRQVSGSTRGVLTSALVGVAGSFVGYHLATIIARSSSPMALFISAALGAAIVLWSWRVVR
jgi:uncharacterized membrane protein YeaQ/YmgE (transglycosylase-associated protein family)